MWYSGVLCTCTLIGHLSVGFEASCVLTTQQAYKLRPDSRCNSER